MLFVGCSYTFGYSVKDDETYVWRLNEQFPDIEFVNASVSGYGTLRSFKRMCDTLPDQDYDLVIYAMIEDHINRDSLPQLRIQLFNEPHYTERANQGYAENVYILPNTEMHEGFRFTNHYLGRFRLWGDAICPLTALLGRYATVSYIALRPTVTKKEALTILSHQVTEMSEVAAMYGCPLLLVALEGFASTLTDGTRINFKGLFSPRLPTFDASFPRPLTNEFRVSHHPTGHPTGVVHAYYAQAVGSYLRQHPVLLNHRVNCNHRTLYDFRSQYWSSRRQP